MERPFWIIDSICAVVLLTTGLLNAQPTEEELARIQQALPDRPVVEVSRPRRLLVFDRCDGFKHSSIPYWNKTLELMGKKTSAFDVTISSDMSVFDAKSLSQFDAVCLNNTTRLTFDQQQRKALLEFIQSGKGLIGIHAASDNFYDWDEAAKLIGARFVKHPWTADKTVTIKVDDPDHPLTRHFAGQAFKVNDEIYVTHPPFYSRSSQRVLMSLDMTDPQTRNVRNVTEQDLDTGISWVKSYGKGRVFYCSLGHNHHICWDPKILMHYLAGIQFALGDLQAQTTPLASAKDGRVRHLQDLIDKAKGYDLDKAPEMIYAVDHAIRQLDEDPAYRLAAEQLLIDALRGPGGIGWKGFLCRQLSVIGSNASIDVLAGLLKDDQISDLARYALERIGGQRASDALLEALPDLPVKAQIAVISSLGNLRDQKAVNTVARFLDSSDIGLRLAALAALGKIGTPQAGEALIRALNQQDPLVRARLLDAAIECADRLAMGQMTDQAIAIYQRVYHADCDATFKVAALAGWIAADKASAARLIRSAIEQPDQVLAVAACGMIDMIPDTQSRVQLMQQINSIPEQCRIAMFVAVARSGDRSLTPIVLQAVMEQKGQARLEAMRALAVLADKDCVGVISKIAAQESGALQEAAREALIVSRGEGIDDQILVELQAAQPPVKCELIRAIAGRSIVKAVPIMLELARSDDRQVRTAASEALGELARPEDLDLMAKILWEMPSPRLESAFAAVCRRTGSSEQGTKAILEVYRNAGPLESRLAAVRVIGQLGSNAGLSMLLDQLNRGDDQIMTEVIRALSQWPNPGPMEHLWSVATSPGDITRRVLALRGYINMVPMKDGISAAQKVRMLQDAWAQASRDEEKRLILSVLPDCACIEAWQMAKVALDSPPLAQEAGSAILRLAGPLAGQYPDQVRPVLEGLRANSDRFVRQRIDQILRRMNQ